MKQANTCCMQDDVLGQSLMLTAQFSLTVDSRRAYQAIVAGSTRHICGHIQQRHLGGLWAMALHVAHVFACVIKDQ